jgi:ATP-dependent DNA helicase RecG
MKYLYNTASPDWYPLLKELAAKHKKFPTDAESYLWLHIRNSQLGVKFNRQHIIGDYIVDFVCLEKHLVIEVDGGYHNDENQKNADEKRTEMLAKMGFRVIRFDNEVILQQIEKVIDLINIELL